MVSIQLPDGSKREFAAPVRFCGTVSRKMPKSLTEALTTCPVAVRSLIALDSITTHPEVVRHVASMDNTKKAEDFFRMTTYWLSWR